MAARPTLTRARVLAAAIDLADESGVESLSMRSLGARLGVEAMSLYNHVSNKDDVLNGMTDLVWAQIDLAPGIDDWRSTRSHGRSTSPDPSSPPSMAASSRLAPSRPSMVRFGSTVSAPFSRTGPWLL